MSEQDSMVEKLARAMHAEFTTQDYTGDYAWSPKEKPGTAVTLDGRFDLHAVARAAISAMREPTEAMWDAFFDGAVKELHYRRRWRAAIDACLQE